MMAWKTEVEMRLQDIRETIPKAEVAYQRRQWSAFWHWVERIERMTGHVREMGVGDQMKEEATDDAGT